MDTSILVVEDEYIVALDIQNSLEKFGYTVSAISDSGDNAIQMASEIQPDLVLMDIHLEGDIDGIEAAEIIREHLNIPVVYLTAYADDATLNRAKSTEPLGYLLKPFSEQELKTTIAIALHRYQAERQLRESQQRLAITLKSIGDAIIVADATARVTFMNPTAEALTGWSQQEALGQDIQVVLRLLHAQTRQVLASPMLKAILEGKTVQLSQNCLLQSRQGQEVLISNSASPIKDDFGAITGGVAVFKDVTQWKQLEEQRLQAVLHDALTQLPNRAALMQRLEQAIRRAQGEPQFAFLLVGLDSSQPPLVWGMGDALMVEIARRLENCLRFGDLVARLEGNEFAVLLENLQDRSQLLQVVERVQQVLKQPFQGVSEQFQVRLNIGIVPASARICHPEQCLCYAREAMEEARVEGGYSCYRVYRPKPVALNLSEQAKFSLQQVLVPTLSAEQIQQVFQLYYQPIISLKTDRISGFEVLLRWQQPEQELSEGAEFVPLGEVAGAIAPVGQWVYQQACQQLCCWQEEFRNHPGLSLRLNLAAAELAQQDRGAEILQILQVTGVSPQRLHLEISPGKVGEHLLAQIRLLAGGGVQFYLSGGSQELPLAGLTRSLPIRGFKLDRRLVRGLGKSEQALAVVQAIAHWAQNQGLELLAAGVETAAQLAQLRQIGCDAAQGYYFAAPLSSRGATLLMQSSCQW